MPSSRNIIVIAVVVVIAAWVAAAPMLSTKLLDAGWFGDGSDEPQGAAVGMRHPLAGAFVTNDTSLQDCARIEEATAERQRCREQALGNVAARRGPAAAFAILEPLVATGDPSWRVDAHSVAHMIGSATLTSGVELGAAFGSGSMVGSAGYYHGIVLTMLQDSDADVGTAIRTTCATPSVTKVEFLRYQCHHGAGHGLMINSGYDLEQSLDTCGEMRNRQHEFDCTTGVFMENYAELLGVGVEGFRSPSLRADDPLYPCNVVAAKHREACYVQVVDALGPAMGWKWDRIADGCRAIPHREHIDSCLDSLGLWANHWGRSEPDEVNRSCAETGSARGQCLYGAARASINSDLTDPAVQRRAGQICEQAPPELQARCYTGIGTVLEQAGSVEHRLGCARLAATWRRQCMQGFRGEGLRPPTLDTAVLA